MKRLLAIEEFLNELLHLGNAGRAPDEDDLVDLGLREAGVCKDALNESKTLLELAGAEALKTGTGDVSAEDLTVEHKVDVNGGFVSSREGDLGTLASRIKAVKSPAGGGKAIHKPFFELLDHELGEETVEVRSTQVVVGSSGLDHNHSFGNKKESNIQGITTKIEDEDVLFRLRTLV